ncbi:hypothetical protein GCM10017653_26190 [Ancylobacter defluvii]|uniref:Uncharacterized protein n=1 Tax=Ancylobacter defluvii TaxID=1282440 RepID=A0A9W6NAJ9_9HYPH|nr:hypothetical protein GCM10017653_26190 [Ancylobacter defluvii]
MLRAYGKAFPICQLPGERGELPAPGKPARRIRHPDKGADSAGMACIDQGRSDVAAGAAGAGAGARGWGRDGGWQQSTGDQRRSEWRW